MIESDQFGLSIIIYLPSETNIEICKNLKKGNTFIEK